MPKELIVKLSRMGGHPLVRQRVQGTILIDTGDEHLDLRIWHMWHHVHVQVSELIGASQKRLGMDVRRRHDPAWYRRSPSETS